MESLSNYPAVESYNERVDLVTKPTTDNLQLSTVNCKGVMMLLEKINGKSLLFCACPYLKLMFSKVFENLSTTKSFIADQIQAMINRS